MRSWRRTTAPSLTRPARSNPRTIGPACAAVISELLAENALFRLRAAQGVLGLGDKHTPDRLEAACAKATTARGR
jgi:hypothetical protein